MKNKKWERNCPKCSKVIFYSTKYKKIRAKNYNCLCKSCSKLGIKRKKQDIKNKKWARKCLKCNIIIKHTTKGNRDRAIKEGWLCRKCSRVELGMYINIEKRFSINKKISDAQWGRKLSIEWKNNISTALQNSNKFKIALKNKERCEKIRKFMKGNGNPSKRKEVRKKISNTIATKIANGEIGYGTNNHFKNGWYENKIDKYWYQSGLELETMKFFDDNGNVIGWTNKHGIRIKYKHPDGNERNYIPDFLIKLKNNKEILIEMKGFGDKKEIIAKKDAAEKIYNNYHLVYSIKKLNEIIKNKGEKTWQNQDRG